MEFLKLYLSSPLRYESFPDLAGAEALFFSGKQRLPEMALWYGVAASQVLSIDPDRTAYMGPLIAAGRIKGTDTEAAFVLQPGMYFFTQIRERLSCDAFIDMAVEVQKEALWRRNKPGKTVFFRMLEEDGAAVSQILRPLEK